MNRKGKRSKLKGSRKRRKGRETTLRHQNQEMVQEIAEKGAVDRGHSTETAGGKKKEKAKSSADPTRRWITKRDDQHGIGRGSVDSVREEKASRETNIQMGRWANKKKERGKLPRTEKAGQNREARKGKTITTHLSKSRGQRRESEREASRESREPSSAEALACKFSESK